MPNRDEQLLKESYEKLNESQKQLENQQDLKKRWTSVRVVALIPVQVFL